MIVAFLLFVAITSTYFEVSAAERPTINDPCPNPAVQSRFAVYSINQKMWCFKKSPSNSGQVWLARFDFNSNDWIFLELPPGELEVTKIAHFGESNLWLFYGVKPLESRSGALSVKVSQFLRQGEIRSSHFIETRLYRGDGFYYYNLPFLRWELADIYNDTFPRRQYDEYHTVEKKGDYELRNKFHAYWKPNFPTNAPFSRRRLFAFEERVGGSDALQNSILLHYDTTARGSWIPFFVAPGGGTDSSLVYFIKIAIHDLAEDDPPSMRKRIIQRRD